jgi:hypothetical protein
MMDIKHPLDSVFGISEDLSEDDINSSYEMIDSTNNANSVPQEDAKDADDILVEKRIDEVYSAAISAFQQQVSYTEIIEPRYAARNAEVAANYLNIALAAANSRAKVKVDRKRTNQFIPHGNSSKTTNNILIANREEILKMITIDDEKKELK